jgi:hypothetical protein
MPNIFRDSLRVAYQGKPLCVSSQSLSELHMFETVLEAGVSSQSYDDTHVSNSDPQAKKGPAFSLSGHGERE